ncbi:putative bifunctional diguanylate cyclase/phosphodiesterase [Methylocucumis oryzae]|uniref:putative bifunctional diguanylate cyclase/phosphodiesterase n=1 Tax=Methylocucumis oryzae TaxID=1632867 RepID=UPI0006989E88|nr:EAL domain-containing protein [Methylocucumis oryzae]
MRERLEHAVTTPNSEEFLIASESSQSLQQATYLTACQVEAEDELKHALAENQFELFYQPIVDLVQCRIIGAEALIRWRHPERGLIPPLEFIPIAEQSDIIIALGLWLIEDACRSYKMFQKVLPDQLNFISINLSSRQFAPPDLAENIKFIFERSRINGEHIKFEITESILMADPINTINTLNEIKKLGASIAIDDFGTGYSSFSYLHRFPIDTLKIDKSFISTMLDNPKSFEIVKSLCVLAKSLGLNIVAEGIESNREHHILKGMSSDYGQGYYYSKPVAAHEFIELLKIKKFEC